jgi:hypothetical protein
LGSISKFAREIGFDVQVLVFRAYALRDANNVGDGGGRGNGDAIRITHPDLPDAGAQGLPIQCAAPVLRHGPLGLRRRSRNRKAPHFPSIARLAGQVSATMPSCVQKNMPRIVTIHVTYFGKCTLNLGRTVLNG